MVEGSPHRVLFAGGGTGGHLMPAINIALELRRLNSKIHPLFVGRTGGMEAPIVNKFGFEIREIEVAGLKRSPLGLMRFIWKWRKGLFQAKRIIREFDPAIVVGTGGYVSAPIVRAASRARKPIFMQEQNSLPGLATRTMSKMAEKVFIAYESATRYLDREKCTLVGNPLRPDIKEAERAKSFASFGLDPTWKTLLVLGGSSGARGINYPVLDMVNSRRIPDNWQILWQTGQNDFVDISSALTAGKLNGHLAAFIFEMPAAYAVADLVVCRAGAMTLAEIAVWNLPSILIPYPFATGDHQTLNARQFVDVGASALVPESAISASLYDTIFALMTDDQKRQDMARAAAGLGRPDAANIIAKSIMERINAV
jgi:UDP-N-acetylglucosamine--N-acetylmuramyl-(pentapeptide) pyrophosphoryl-undecaprenol N-acetylglucosamine transferase